MKHLQPSVQSSVMLTQSWFQDTTAFNLGYNRPSIIDHGIESCRITS